MILNIFKPRGCTSFFIVKRIRGIIKGKKVGHGGTLDPFAEGVLIIGTGKDTKKLSNFINESKVYEAELKLGKMTNTLDPEGKIIDIKKVPILSKKKIIKVLDSFLGESLQVPPMFSAKKIFLFFFFNLLQRSISSKYKKKFSSKYPVSLHS